MTLRNKPIQQQLMLVILMTTGIVLLLTCAAFFAYEIIAFRQAKVRELSTLGEVIASNSIAALAFDNPDDAREILTALKADKHITGGALYNRAGKLFSQYPSTL